MNRSLYFIIFSLFLSPCLFAQNRDSTHNQSLNADYPPGPSAESNKVNYPKVVGYMSFIIPVFTSNRSGTTNDFANNFQTFAIGFPVGINVLYSKHFGFSYEITPTIQNAKTGSKTSKILFDPGPMFRFNHDFTIISRLAFETSGRYGFTPVFNYIYLKTRVANYFVSGSIPVRFGNGESSSIGFSTQFGLIFN